ncbi:lipase prepro protein [Helicostylum pulchrum]|uniref:Fungal lipase-type domain-containing protein n=1 Tax=Helicostylum pulchrum TaxID=562976 RepID=A0ABP9XKP7_9FUNG|nr:lipase prepro protein [Helicostylum pulchrum]
MVSFTSITKGAFLVSAMMLSLASATTAEDDTAGVRTDLPPLIPSRVQPAPITQKSIFGSDRVLAIERTEDVRPNSFQGMDMEISADAPPFAQFINSSSVMSATEAQIQQFKLFAAVASTAYCRTVVPNGSWSCKNCLEYIPDGQLLTTFGSILSDTSGLVIRSDAQKTIHLVFRGTNSIRQSIVDLIFIQKDYPPVPGAKIHSGFYDSYKENLDQYFSLVQEQLTEHPDYNIVISGHSLGGAQALLAGLNLYQRDERVTPDNLKIYTVGGPRVGNPEFAHYVSSTNIPFFRSVGRRDIVPHLPPQILGYLHAGVESWETSGEEVRVCTSTIETDECSNSIIPFTSFLDHLTYYNLNEGLCQ